VTVVEHRRSPSVTQGAEALFEEARRRRRRRWIVGVVFLLLFSGAGVYALGGPSAGPTTTTLTHSKVGAFHLGPAGPSLGAAAAYPLTGPLSVALDRYHDLYLTDANEVLRVDLATKQISVVAGTNTITTNLNSFWGDGGPATKAGLAAPSDVAVAPNGNLYIVDFWNDRVREVSAVTGIISTVAGDGTRGFSGDGGPAIRARLDLDYENFSSSIALDANGDLYIADGGNNRVRRVSAATGTITTVAGDGRVGNTGDGSPATRAELDLPSGIALDEVGNLFVASGRTIREVSASTGVITTVLGLQSGNSPVGLGFGRHGSLFFTSGYGRQVWSLNLMTHRLHVVAGTGTQTIQKPGATGGDGGPATRATFGLAAGLAVDSSGNLYVADLFNNSVRRIDSRTGIMTNVVGQIPQSPAHCC
jgi:sugar lactone lactonase YvrE